MNPPATDTYGLTAEKLERFDRQIMLPEIGRAGQQRLFRSKVLVAGAGGLGSPISIYLAAAGIGTIKVVDNDRVSLSNLNRQILHGDGDIGKYKVDSARESLHNLCVQTTIEVRNEKITAANAADLASDCDLIVDAMDNIETRYILNQAAIHNLIPFVHGAVNGFEGRAMTVVPGKSACLRCMHKGPAPAAATFPVIGVAPGVIGAIQATEAIKAILGIGTLLCDRLLAYDGLHMKWSEFKLKRNPDCDHCGHL